MRSENFLNDVLVCAVKWEDEVILEATLKELFEGGLALTPSAWAACLRFYASMNTPDAWQKGLKVTLVLS